MIGGEIFIGFGVGGKIGYSPGGIGMRDATGIELGLWDASVVGVGLS